MKSLYWEKGEFKLWILFLCAFHFFPFITTRGSLVMYAWAYGLPLIYILLNLNYLKKIISFIAHSEVLITVVFIAVLTCASILIPVVYGTGDMTYFSDAIMTMIKIIIRMLFLVMIIIKYIPNATRETFMKYFIFSCCLYVCGTVVMLLSPGIKNIFWELVKESEHAKKLALETRYSTRYGWAGFSGFEYTFKCVLALIFNDYLINKSIKKNKVWLMIGVSVILIVGTLFYGRIGSLFGILVIGVMFLRLLAKRPKLLIVVICGGVAAAIGLLILQSRNTAIQAWFEWAFDLFVTFIRTGKFETESSNVLLQQMLFIPETETLLFGDGRYTTPTGYYMSTDAGIMRATLFGGLVFAIIRYLSVYLVFAIKILKDGQTKADIWLYAWMFLLCFVFEIKGEILFSCLPIFIWLIVMDKYEKWRNQDGKRFGF